MVPGAVAAQTLTEPRQTAPSLRCSTADAYSNGDSEVIIGKAIKRFNIPRESVVILTKVRPPSLLTLPPTNDRVPPRHQQSG